MISDDRVDCANSTWQRDEIINIAIKDSDLSRNIDGLPYLKDILDIGYSYCKSDNDIILYTNADIGLVQQQVIFPENNFFCVRKNVDKNGIYTSDDLININYENSINCDVFGITKKWYDENRNEIPDFLIGSPAWDLCLLLLIHGLRIDNICYHVKHDAQWKKDNRHPKHIRNKKLFVNFCKKKNIPILKEDYSDTDFDKFCELMSNNFGFTYLANPKYIIYSTKSHTKLLNLNINSIRKVYGDDVIVHTIEDNNQYCETASYHTSGWRETQVNKLDSLINTLGKLRDNEIFIFCDADVVHLKNYLKQIKESLKDFDLVAQKSFTNNSPHGFCSGFYCARKTPKVLRFLGYIRQSLKSQLNNESNADQYYFNEYSKTLNMGALDDSYFSPGLITNGTVVNEESLLSIADAVPKNIKIIHANWIKGVESKISFLIRSQAN
jgi:hypothetical protein